MKKVLVVFAVIVMLAGIIFAFSADMVSGLIYDVENDKMPTGLGSHVVVELLFVTVSNLILLGVSKGITLGRKRGLFHAVYELTGLFFALASAFQARANKLLSFYTEMNHAPSFWGGEWTDKHWFELLPTYANKFSNRATLFYILTILGLIAFIAVTVTAFKKPTVTNDQQIG